MSKQTIAVDLPHGFYREGVFHREAHLRPMTGEDEAFLCESEILHPARKTTELLSRCVTRLGSMTEVTNDTIGSLTIGDREALLLHLRRLTFGERLTGTLKCPQEDCAELLDLDLSVSRFLQPRYANPKDWHETFINENGAKYIVNFRLPNGADQEKAAELAQQDTSKAIQTMLKRCIKQVTQNGPDQMVLDEIPGAVAKKLPAIMAELDPQAEIILNLKCPSCGHSFATLFDTSRYLFKEISYRIAQLYREIHILAFHYHWSEAAIMGMSTKKREHYLGLLREELNGDAGR